MTKVSVFSVPRCRFAPTRFIFFCFSSLTPESLTPETFNSSIRNPQSPHWLSSQERSGHLAKYCDLTRAFGKFTLLQISDIPAFLAFVLFWHRFCKREINKQKQIAKF
jgi:hypothetical protein